MVQGHLCLDKATSPPLNAAHTTLERLGWLDLCRFGLNQTQTRVTEDG